MGFENKNFFLIIIIRSFFINQSNNVSFNSILPHTYITAYQCLIVAEGAVSTQRYCKITVKISFIFANICAAYNIEGGIILFARSFRFRIAFCDIGFLDFGFSFNLGLCVGGEVFFGLGFLII